MKLASQTTYQKGFTLIEVLVVVTIISVLAGVAAYGAVESGQKSRDTKRQADLTMLQSAVELYKSKYGLYPEGCNAPGNWSGQIGSDYECPDGTNRYIVGVAGRWFSEFMTTLPLDKKMNGTNSGYVYRVNTDGTVYKLKAHRTVESETVLYTHEFKPCDVRVASNPDGSLVSGSRNREIIGWCGRVFHTSNDLPPACNVTNDEWRYSYGVWGGFKPKLSGADVCGVHINCVTTIVNDTTDVICR